MPIEPLLWMFAGVCFFSLGLLVGYGMCEDKQNRRRDGENHETYGAENDEYKCDTCAYRCVNSYTEPCAHCMDGSKYEPKEGSENHDD